MRWVRLVNPVGFALAALCLLLPFVHNQTRAAGLVAGGFGWTGLQLALGGTMSENLRMVRYGQDGSVTEAPVTVKALYGEPYVNAVAHLPAHVAGMVAAALLLLGALTALMASRSTRGIAAAIVAVAAMAGMGIAQYQTLHQVSRVWASELVRNPMPFRPAEYDPVTATAYGFWVFLALTTVLAVTNILLMGPSEARTDVAARELTASGHNGPA
jgi:hypothetical protein